MGDERRNVIFAHWIKVNFPRCKSVLVVADGHGELARKLANYGLQVTVVEKQPRFVGRDHSGINYLQGEFDRNYPVEQDLAVAMHPDEATEETILAAEKSSKPWAVVPCCIKGKSAPFCSGGYKEWLDKLSSLSHRPVGRGTLRIRGKNIVLCGR